MTSNTVHLPTQMRFGYVCDRILRAVADTPNDEDRLPDGIAAQGQVVFTPMHPLRQVTFNGRGVHVTKEPVTCRIDDGKTDPAKIGALIDPAGVSGGVWLPVGAWRVDYKFDDWGASIPSFTFTVTEDHTEDEPLDLALVSEIPQVPGVKWVVNEQVYVDTLAARDRAEVAADDAYAFREDAGMLRDEVQGNLHNMVTFGEVVGDDLWLTRHGGDLIVAGNVRGPRGPQGLQGERGPQGEQGLPGVPGDLESGIDYAAIFLGAYNGN